MKESSLSQQSRLQWRSVSVTVATAAAIALFVGFASGSSSRLSRQSPQVIQLSGAQVVVLERSFERLADLEPLNWC